MNKRLKILVIEDEAAIRRGLCSVLSFHEYDVASASNGEQGLRMALSSNYDLIILDVMLPGCDGFTVCTKIREVDPEQAIIMLTAKSSDDDIITGLQLGADDYVSKPFSIVELLLRIEAILRRSGRVRELAATISVGGLTIDTRTLKGSWQHDQEHRKQRKNVRFTSREIEILDYLNRNSERPVPRGELLAEVWGYAKHGSYETRTIDIHIGKLRKKIEDAPDNPRHLVTVRGKGYQLKAQH